MNQISLKKTQNMLREAWTGKKKIVMEILKKASFFEAIFCPEKLAASRRLPFSHSIFPCPHSLYSVIASSPRRNGQACKAQRQRDYGAMAMRLRRKDNGLQPKRANIYGQKANEICNSIIINTLQASLRMAYLRASLRLVGYAQTFYKMF